MNSFEPTRDNDRLQCVLNRLSDSIAGLRLAADFSTDPAFIRLCEVTAELREPLEEELASIIAANGGSPSLHGSREAAVHRAWIRFLCQLLPGARERLRSEVKRGEGHFLRSLEARHIPHARNERTGLLFAALRASAAETLSELAGAPPPAQRRTLLAAA